MCTCCMGGGSVSIRGRTVKVASAKPPPGPVLGLSATTTLYSATGLSGSAHHITMVSSWQPLTIDNG